MQKFNISIPCMSKIKSTDLSFGNGESYIMLLNLYFLSRSPCAFFMLSYFFMLYSCRKTVKITALIDKKGRKIIHLEMDGSS